MKRILTTKLGLLVAMLLTILPASAYDFEVDGIYYQIVSLPDLTCAVVRGNEKYEGDIIIPSEVIYNSKALKVTVIAGGAFYKCTSLTSVVIPDSMTKISWEAFYYCTSLTSVVIPDSVNEIGDKAFYGCDSLESLYIGKSVVSIGKSSFEYCDALTSVVIPDSVNEIGEHAFSGCKSLASIVIPDSVTEIGSYAFCGCTSLASIVIPDSVTEIAPYAFYGCTSLASIVIPDSVTGIGHYAFYKCTSLASIVIPDYVTEIGSYAFYGCTSLTEIKLSESLTTLNYGTFEFCESLKSITIPGNVNKLVQYKYDNPDYWDKTVDYIFEGCSSLKEIRFDYSEATLYGYCYRKSQVRADIELKINKDEMLEIEKVFIDRELGNTLRLPYLKELTLGQHVTQVQISPYTSSELEIITCYAIEPPKCPNFSNVQYMNITMRVPNESLEAYKTAEGWKNFWNLEGFDATTAAIEDIVSDECISEVGRFDINGNPVSSDYIGIVIIRYSNGTTKKSISRK